MRRVLDEVPIPDHWTEVGVHEVVGDSFMIRDNATYIRYFSTNWNGGADCAIGERLFPQCSVAMSTRVKSCTCRWTLPDFSFFADKSVPRYELMFDITVRQPPPKVGEWAVDVDCRGYTIEGDLAIRKPLCRVEEGKALVTLSIIDRHEKQ